MASLKPGNMAAAGLRALNLAHSVAEAGRAAPGITAPVQNLMVADRACIGLFVTGRVPIRRAGDGFAPVEGADGAHDWIGWASGEQLPHIVAPASGQLVNANERVAPPDFPGVPGPRLVRRLARPAHPRAARRHAAPDAGGFRADAVSTWSARSRATCCRCCWRSRSRIRARWRRSACCAGGTAAWRATCRSR